MVVIAKYYKQKTTCALVQAGRDYTDKFVDTGEISCDFISCLPTFIRQVTMRCVNAVDDKVRQWI